MTTVAAVEAAAVVDAAEAVDTAEAADAIAGRFGKGALAPFFYFGRPVSARINRVVLCRTRYS